MSTIEAIGIAGFRSYNPAAMQKIQFSKPLTLIWGPNGAGKTTIIQVMKYIMAGILPPSCERGKNFLMDPRIVGQSEMIGEIRLKFTTYTSRQVIAVKKSMFSINNRGNRFESTVQVLRTKDQQTGDQLQINHHCSQIQKQIPFLLGTSKAIIDKVMFCHQEQSLWPFQDSSILKTIFDELFETKKYTQMIEALWDQRKQLQKRIAEIKKALPYQQKIYLEDKRRKGTTLRQMQEAKKQIKEKITPIRQKLQTTETELNSGKLNINTGERIRLAQQKRSLQDKIKSNKIEIQMTIQKLKMISTQFERLTGTKIIFDKDQNQEFIKQSEDNTNQLKEQKQQLCRILQNFKYNQRISQKEVDLQNQINFAKQFLPQLKNEYSTIINDELVFKKITAKKQQMEKKIQRIKFLEGQQKKCHDELQKNIIQKLMNPSQFKTQKARFDSDVNIFQELKSKILSYYFALYKPIDKNASVYKKQDNVSVQLQEVATRIKIKKQQLQKYKNMPKEIPVGKKIDRLQFAGIEFYDNYTHYCNQKKKCSFCSKPMTEQQLAIISAKCQKIKQKSEAQLKELHQQLQRGFNCGHIDGDPEVMIIKIQEQIENLLEQQKKLTQQFKRYEMTMKLHEQRKINDKLLQGIKIANLQLQLDKGSSNMYEKYSKQATIELYSEYARKYIDMSNQIHWAKRNIETYQKQQAENKKKQQQRQKIQLKIKQINDELPNLRQQTKNYQFIIKIIDKLTRLIKQKQTMSKFGQKENKSETINTQALKQRFNQIDKEIKLIELKGEFYNISNKLEIIKSQNIRLIQHIQTFEYQIKQLQNLFNERSKKQEQYNTLKTNYEKHAHSLLVKADIAFDEYKRLKTEKEYLIMKSKLEDAQKASRDIETYCRVVQNTISRIHQQKMDQINKILSDIWKQVYHQKDIAYIQIETLINQDSKKRRNYHYSIVMFKAGPQNIKLEMRGRCSMGQKVLASLVIRMALAEVFASSARFLALDQPTTNLDQGHIDNLAKELSKIIEMNEGSNFQMVIITHDMQLIKKLEQFTSSYYEINRVDNKFSKITRKEIGELYRKF